MVALFRTLAIWGLSVACFAVLPAPAQADPAIEACVKHLMQFEVDDAWSAAKIERDDTAARGICKAFNKPDTDHGIFRVNVNHGAATLEIAEQQEGEKNYPQLSGRLIAEIIQSEAIFALLPDMWADTPIHTLTIDGGIIEGTISLRRTKIDRTINLQNCTLVPPSDGGLSLAIIASEISGSLRFEDCSYSGNIYINATQIDQNLIIESSAHNNIVYSNVNPIAANTDKRTAEV